MDFSLARLVAYKVNRRYTLLLAFSTAHAEQSGVALRFPPRSKTWRMPESSLLIPPRRHTDRVEAVEIRLDVGGRTVVWCHKILRFVGAKSTGAGRCLGLSGKLKGWELMADTWADARFVPMKC